jgi:hypothetical protein
MNLAGLQAILMHLSVTPLRTSTTTEKTLKNFNTLDKKVTNTEDNSVMDSLNSFIDPDEQFNEEMSVEKSFAELSGKRKIVTYESLVGWDVVAELLQDGALNKEVRVVDRVEWSGVLCCVVLCSAVYSTVVFYHIPSSLLSSPIFPLSPFFPLSPLFPLFALLSLNPLSLLSLPSFPSLPSSLFYSNRT